MPPAMSQSTSKPLPTWRVIHIAAKGREICELQAKTADAAIQRTIREFGIEAERRWRLAASRVS